METAKLPIEGYPAAVAAHGFVYGTTITDRVVEDKKRHQDVCRAFAGVIGGQLGDPIRTHATAIVGFGSAPTNLRDNSQSCKKGG